MSTPSQFSPNPAPKPSGGGGMSVLMILLIIGGVLLLVCGGARGCMLVVNRAAKEVGSAIELLPTQISAMSAVESDQAVREKLGEPITQSSPPAREGSGELKSAGETFNFDISGPNGTAKVKASAEKVNGSWKITVITVMASDGTTVNVTPPEPTSDFTMPEMPDIPDEAK